MPTATLIGTINLPLSKTIKFYTDSSIGPSIGISPISYVNVDGFSYANIFVKFSQQSIN